MPAVLLDRDIVAFPQPILFDTGASAMLERMDNPAFPPRDIMALPYLFGRRLRGSAGRF